MSLDEPTVFSPDIHKVGASGTERMADGLGVEVREGDLIPRSLGESLVGFTSAEVVAWVVGTGFGGVAINGSASPAELAGRRVGIDLSHASHVRLAAEVETAGSTGAELRLQFAVDPAGTWAEFAATNQPLVSLASTGSKDSGAIAIPPEAAAPIVLRLVGAGGVGGEALVSLIEISVQPA